MRLISPDLLDPIQMLWQYMKWDKGMDINLEDATFYITWHKEAFLNHGDIEYCAK